MRSGILREDLRAFLVGQSNGPGDVEQGVFFSHYYRELQNFDSCMDIFDVMVSLSPRICAIYMKEHFFLQVFPNTTPGFRETRQFLQKTARPPETGLIKVPTPIR